MNQILDVAGLNRVLRAQQITDHDGFLASLLNHAKTYRLALLHYVDATTGKQSFKLRNADGTLSETFQVGDEPETLDKNLYALIGKAGGLVA